jgi:hypothetical protein
MDAVRIPGGNTQWWIKCAYTETVDACQVFKARGDVLADEVFRPYDGGPPVAAIELRIDPTRSNPTKVRLENGRVLLPSTNFDGFKQLLDEKHRRQRER